MLELRNVYKRYSGIPAVEGVSFCARAGEVTGYLGAERIGQVDDHEDDHRADRDGLPARYCSQAEHIHDDLIAYKSRIGYVPEEPQLYTHLSGVEYLEMVAQLRGLPRKRGCRIDRRNASLVRTA